MRIERRDVNLIDVQHLVVAYVDRRLQKYAQALESLTSAED